MRALESEADRLLTAEQVAVRWQCSARLVYQLAKAGQIPTVRIGPKLLRFNVETIKNWEQAQQEMEGVK